MQFIPVMPIYLSSIALFGLVLLAGLVGGALAARTKVLPTITGYILVGFIFGPGGADILDSEVLANTRLFVDLAMSLILFELGRSFDVMWLLRDRGLLFTALFESALTFIVVFLLLIFPAGMPTLAALLGATIAVATSPAVLFTVALDVQASGPVTRRAFILTGFNNFVALTIFTFLLPLTQVKGLSDITWLGMASYRYICSILVGLTMFVILSVLAIITGKRFENQFVLFIAVIVLTLGISTTLGVSNMLALFILGVATRNLDQRHAFVEVDFKWLARIFLILLFVVIGVHLQLSGLWQATATVMLFVLGRFLAKTSAIFMFYRTSRLTFNQATALSLTMVPMAGIAIGMSNVLMDYNMGYAYHYASMIAAVVAVLSIIGPVLTQIAFIQTGEAAEKKIA